MGARTLPLDSGSALVEAREKKAAQGNRLDADRCRFLSVGLRDMLGPDVEPGVLLKSATCEI